mgnify:CR=1 FL=1
MTDDEKKKQRVAERRAKFAEGRKEHLNSKSQVFDKSLSQNDTNKVISPAARESKVEAFREARRKMLGKGKEEVGDTLDYRDLRKQMSSGKKAITKGLTKGLKSLPVIGSLAALATSGDASAAIPGLDSAESAGMSGEAENKMMAEIKAKKDYGNSQASADSKKAKVAALAKLSKSKKKSI